MKVTQSCLTLQRHGLYRPWNSPGQNIGVGSLSLLQGIFPTQGLNPGLPHCRQILYQLSHQGSPSIDINQLNFTFGPTSCWVDKSFLRFPCPFPGCIQALRSSVWESCSLEISKDRAERHWWSAWSGFSQPWGKAWGPFSVLAGHVLFMQRKPKQSFHLVFLSYSEKERESGDPTGSQSRESVFAQGPCNAFSSSPSSPHTLHWQKLQSWPGSLLSVNVILSARPSPGPWQWWWKYPRELWWPGEASWGCHYSGLHTSSEWNRSLHMLLFCPLFSHHQRFSWSSFLRAWIPFVPLWAIPYTNPHMNPAEVPCSASCTIHLALSTLSSFLQVISYVSGLFSFGSRDSFLCVSFKPSTTYSVWCHCCFHGNTRGVFGGL